MSAFRGLENECSRTVLNLSKFFEALFCGIVTVGQDVTIPGM